MVLEADETGDRTGQVGRQGGQGLRSSGIYVWARALRNPGAPADTLDVAVPFGVAWMRSVVWFSRKLMVGS
jgi:hypothetical protein